MDKQQPIGFFDSGLGGLNVLAAAVRQLPGEHFLYLGDSANAPYGTRTDEEVLALTLAGVHSLVDQGIKALVLACNTATGAAINALRARYAFPIIGLEPALKLAHDTHQQGAILVMATPLTIESDKYADLYHQYGRQAINLPCPGLADLIEQEELDSPALVAYLAQLLSPYADLSIDAVVLGCTHYLFIRDAIARHLPGGTRVLDSNEGVVRQLQRQLEKNQLLNDSAQPGSISLHSTGSPQKAAQMERMWRLAQQLYG